VCRTLKNVPIISKDNNTIFIKDIATVQDAADITVDYALINGKRSVYIPVVKTADASTWNVVQNLKNTLPEMQSLLPGDIQVNYEFDQSVFCNQCSQEFNDRGHSWGFTYRLHGNAFF